MKKIIWGSFFVGIVMLIVILLLVVLGKEISDLIFSIFVGAMAVCIVLAIAIQRKNYIENNSKL